MGQASEGSARARVLFVHPRMSPFIQADLDLLERHFEVRRVDIGSIRRGIAGNLAAGYRIMRGLMWADVAFCWFAEKHAKWTVRLSRMIGRPSVVVVGGYEVASLPEIGHGSLLDPKKARIVRYVHERATVVLPVHESLGENAVRLLGVKSENIKPLHTGYDSGKFKPLGAKENMVLTVGMFNRTAIRLKGLDVFVQAASRVPEARFVIVGHAPDGSMEQLKATAPPNVEFAGFVPHDEVVRCYQRAKVYCQLSMYEGLPNALCEAMLCECVPVGTRVSGIPTAIGDTGFYAPVGDPEAAAEAIKMALRSDKGKDARARVMELFSFERREKALAEMIERLAR